MDPIVHQAVDGGEEYNINSANRFLSDLGLPRETLILTSHFHNPIDWWHKKLLWWTRNPAYSDKVHNIYAGVRSQFGRWGYALYQNGILEFVGMADGAPDPELSGRYIAGSEIAAGLEEPP